MAALELVSKDRAREKLKFCADHYVMPTFYDQLVTSFERDMTIEVYLKGSEIPFVGIVYQMWDDSFVLVEDSGKITRIYSLEIQSLRWQIDHPDPKVIEYIKQNVKNP